MADHDDLLASEMAERSTPPTAVSNTANVLPPCTRGRRNQSRVWTVSIVIFAVCLSCINRKLLISPHFQRCWLKNLTSLVKAHKIVAQIKNVDPGKWNDVKVNTLDITRCLAKRNSNAESTEQMALLIHYQIHVNPSEGYYSFYYMLGCKGSSQHTIECVFCDEYVKVIIDLVRDSNVSASFLAIQHSRLQAHKIVAQIKNVDPGKWNDVVKLGTVNVVGTSGNNQRNFQMALADVTNTQPNSQHVPTRQRKTINNICRLRSNLYNDFVAASSTSTGLLNNEIHDHSFVPQHANDPLHHTNEASLDNNTENAETYDSVLDDENELSDYVDDSTHDISTGFVVSMHKF
ncbi:hypothetical protein JHK87_024425 [Glycine soja]|nr:hypothetical protein JHK87_024425 [Glycine soja]